MSIFRDGSVRRKAATAAAIALICVGSSVGAASAEPADLTAPATQGGPVLGLPPLPALAGGAAGQLTSPEFWTNYVREVRHNSVLLPIPADPVKPDLALPHAHIAAGDVVSPLPEAPIDLRAVTYQWDGATKTVADYLNDTGTDAIEFAHNGTLVAQYFSDGWSNDDAHQAWSTTKSFVSTLVGIALDQHRISSLDDPIEDYIPELRGTAWAGTSIENLLRMRSGVQWDEHAEDLSQNTQVAEWIALAQDNYTAGAAGMTRNEFLKSLPRTEPAGARFNYNSANTQVLAWMLEQIYQQSFADILSQQLWQPAGMEAPADIMTDRTGAAVASEELFAHPRDFVRLGELMRSGGRIPDGRRIVSADWVAAATTEMLPAMDAGDVTPGGYGYQWWSGATPDGFQANGFQGQYLTVAPSQCLTGVRLAHTVQFDSSIEFAGQGNEEWHTVYRAIADRLGGCG